MIGISGVAIFCEDIRREASGRTTVIGMMADTTIVPKLPSKLRRLSVYFRVKLEVGRKYEHEISVDLDVTGIEVQHANPEAIPLEMIHSSLKIAEERGFPHATISGRMTLEEPVPIPASCEMRAILRSGDESQLCGILKVIARTELPLTDETS